MSLKLIVLLALVAVAVAAPKNALKPTVRIVGGHNARSGQFPWQVSLEIQYNDNSYFHFCGGVIMSNAWVLTAGHCGKYDTSKGQFVVKAGTTNLRQLESTTQIVPVAKRFIHPDYQNGDTSSDICLLKLDKYFNINDHVKGIIFYMPGYTPSGMATLSGWGGMQKDGGPTPDMLQTAELPIVDYNTCRQTIGDLTTSKTICTGSPNGVLGACYGDSGSPLIIYNNNVPVLIGITSWVIPPCGSSISGFVGVSPFANWILDITSHN